MANHTVKLTVGGPVQVKQGTYVSRPADESLLNACQESRFAYVLACRQIGKSSLMYETSRKLTEAGTKTALIDLNSIGQLAEADNWYFSLVDEIARKLELEVDMQSWWEARPRLSTLTQRFLQFLREVVLKEILEPVIIFVDEIDMTLNLNFTDDFFAAIRSVYNDRAQHPAYRRLTFVLLGVATPDELIKDHTRTPFNIGQAISLRDFSKAECQLFQAELEAEYPAQGLHYFDQIYEWTGGHPYLTQKLCAAVLEAIPSELETFNSDLVEMLVRKLFFTAGARGDANIQFVQTRVTGDPHVQEMLKIYKRILTQKQPVQDDEQSPAINRLKLYGLVLAKNGRLAVRNKLYAEVFDLAWTNEMLRLSSATVRLGLPDHYKILQEIGQGGFSTVYLAQLKNAEKTQAVALKVLRTDAIDDGQLVKRFKQEARTVAKLNHPHIIRIFETQEDEETFFIAMEYIPGGTVRNRLKAGALPRDEAVHIVRCIGDALAHTHERGVIHRDIKPGNILLDTGQESLRPVLTDFGLIKLLFTDDLTRIESSAVLGTLDYMAPEQWGKQTPTPATDVYALAITFFEMLSGHRPFVANSPLELMTKHTNEPLPLLSNVAPEIGPYFDELLLKAAAKDPTDRYATMVDFLEALEEANKQAERVERIEQKNKASKTVDAVLGYIQTGRYDPDRALAMIEAALEMYPGYLEALRLRAKIRLDQNQVERALQDYQQAYEQVKDPATEVGFEYLGILSRVGADYWQRQKYEQAVKYYQAIMQVAGGLNHQVAAVQKIWAVARTRLIEYHHHEGDVAFAWGNPEDIDQAINLLGQKMQALEELEALKEVQDLQSKLDRLRVTRYENIIQAAETSIDDISAKGSTIRFSNEDIFQHYYAIDKAYQGLLELEPDNRDWLEKRHKRLQECVESRCVFASRALAKLEPDYETALRHYQAVLEIDQTQYPGIAEKLNLNLDKKIAELRTKVNYDGKYNEIRQLIDHQDYQGALERLDREFIQTGNYGHRDVARWLWGLMYAKKHDGIFPPEWESLSGFESLSKYLIGLERPRIQKLRERVEPWSQSRILKTIDHENRRLAGFETQVKDIETILAETAACCQAEIPDLEQHHHELNRIEESIEAQRSVFFHLEVNETAQIFEACLQKIEEIEALLQTGDPVKDIPQFLARIDAEQQTIEKDETFGMLQGLLATNASLGQQIEEIKLLVPGRLVRLLINENGQKQEELTRTRLEMAETQERLTATRQKESSLQQRIEELERLYKVYSASLIPALILGGVIGILVMMTDVVINDAFWVLFVAAVAIVIWTGIFLFFQRRR